MCAAANATVRLDHLILSNGYTIPLSARTTNASGEGDERVDKDGKIKGGFGPPDAGIPFILGATGVLTGTLAGQSLGGAALGGVAGLGAGFAYLLLAPGSDLELPRDTTVDMALQTPLQLDVARVQFTDAGRASTIPAPAGRRPRVVYRSWP